MTDDPSGWGWVVGQATWHYFVHGRSLCERVIGQPYQHQDIPLQWQCRPCLVRVVQQHLIVPPQEPVKAGDR